MVIATVLLAVTNYNLQKPILRVISPVDLISYLVIIGLAISSIYSLTDLGAFGVLLEPQPTITWVMVAYALFFQGWSHTLFAALALKRSSPVMLSMYTTLIPGISSSLAYLLLGEKVDGGQLVGIVFVVVSVAASALTDESSSHVGDEKKAELMDSGA